MCVNVYSIFLRRRFFFTCEIVLKKHIHKTMYKRQCKEKIIEKHKKRTE